MAVKIRLRRVGKKKAPTYRIVVADSRSPREGRFIEQVGHYDPRRFEVFQIQQDRIQFWISRGAKPTSRVLRLMERAEKAKETEKEAQDEGAD
ncbi:30S ribosomal protein S16 [candidate division TA06 bacterium]|nr:30S ribosomal protein S16 [candidate division TA06 bacterium]